MKRILSIIMINIEAPTKKKNICNNLQKKKKYAIKLYNKQNNNIIEIY